MRYVTVVLLMGLLLCVLSNIVFYCLFGPVASYAQLWSVFLQEYLTSWYSIAAVAVGLILTWLIMIDSPSASKVASRAFLIGAFETLAIVFLSPVLARKVGEVSSVVLFDEVRVAFIGVIGFTAVMCACLAGFFLIMNSEKNKAW